MRGYLIMIIYKIVIDYYILLNNSYRFASVRVLNLNL